MSELKVMTDEEIDQIDEPDEWVAAVTAKMEATRVCIPVIGGLCEIMFTPGLGCGTDPDAHPGVSFELLMDRPRSLYPVLGKFGCGAGVFTRSHALALRDMLDQFLAEHPPVVGFGER